MSELPASHVLVDNECACLRPATSKADRTTQHVGNQLVYLPVIHSDVNNAALALAKLKCSSVVHGTARKESPLLVGDAHGGALTCDRIGRIFEALAFAALDPDVAAKRSFHSFRIFAACCHRANNEDDVTTQALSRWRTSASLKIYARTNPRDYAAHVRRMSATHVDSTIAAILPSLDDSALHADFAQVVGPLERGRDISETCPMYESDDDEAADADVGGAAHAPAPRQRRACASAPATPAAKPRERKRGAAPALATPVRPANGKRNTLETSAITVQQHNPKRPGSASHRCYENYKRARTRDEFLALGGSAADLNHDSRKGFVVSDSPQRAIKRRTAEGQQ